MKTESALYIELRLGPRAENQTRFWFGHELGDRAGIGGRKVDHRSARQFGGGITGSQAGDVIKCFVAAEGQYRAEFFRPLDFVFHIKTDHRVGKSIHIRVRGQDRHQVRIGIACVDGFVIACVDIVLVRAHAIFRAVKAVVDPIVADLQSERVFHLAAEPLAENRVACVDPSHKAAVLLFELITLNGVIQVVGEIGKQIEVVIKSVGHDLRFGMIVLAMPFRLQAITLRIAAVSWVQRAEETNKGRRGDRDLVARVPFSVVSVGRNAEAIGFVALAVASEGRCNLE